MLLECAINELQKVVSREHSDQNEEAYLNSLICSVEVNGDRISLSMIQAVFLSISIWCDSQLQDYHLHFSKGTPSTNAMKPSPKAIQKVSSSDEEDDCSDESSNDEPQTQPKAQQKTGIPTTNALKPSSKAAKKDSGSDEESSEEEESEEETPVKKVTKEGLAARVVDRQQIHQTMSKEEVLHLFDFGDEENAEVEEDLLSSNIGSIGAPLKQKPMRLSKLSCSSDKFMESLLSRHYPGWIANYHESTKHCCKRMKRRGYQKRSRIWHGKHSSEQWSGKK